MKLTRKQYDQILNISGESVDGKYLLGTCPQCNSPELYILFKEDNQPGGCSRKSKCGFKFNVYTLLKYLGKAKDFLTEREINIFEKLESELEEKKQEINLELPEVRPPLLWQRKYEDEYLTKRGFTKYQFGKFEVGRSKINPDYITFLVRRNNKLIGYISRSEKSKDWIDEYNKKAKEENKDIYLRYKNSSTDFSRTLFGIDEVIKGETKYIILVEGIFSKTKTDANLHLDEQTEIKCCATFGAKLSLEQIELLKQKEVENIWLWFEADVLEKVKSVAAQAALHFNVRVSYLNGKDPNDIDENEALKLLEDSKEWLDFNTSYIESKLQL